jgi:glycosyltransferase involved in cell wall biosynthesis
VVQRPNTTQPLAPPRGRALGQMSGGDERVLRKLRVLYAHCFYRTPGGEDRHVRDQIELVSGAHDVEFISESNVDLEDTAVTAARMLYSRDKKQHLGGIIDRFAPDVVHVHNAYPSLGPAVLLAAYERGLPVVMTVHNFRLRCPNGFMFTEGAPCRRCERGIYLNAVAHRCFPTRRQAGAYAAVLWAHRFVMRLEGRIARFVAPSQFMRQRLLEWGLDEDRVRMIRHFVQPTEGSGVGMSTGSYGVFLGRLSPEKGLHILLAALSRAGDPPFLVIGDGPQRSELEALNRKLRLANTEFLGWRSPEEVARLVAAARYVAIPSVWEETANLAALEALAAGRPLLVSKRGALPELVATGAGIVSRPGDELDLAEKITHLMQDEELCRRASSEALKFARRWLRPEQHLADLESLYRDLSTSEVA